MKIFLALCLCLSVLLSGCITANTSIFKPEPDSGGDVFWRIIGGWWDVEFTTGPLIILWTILYYQQSNNEARNALLIAALLAPIGLILADVGMRNALPYRKAYYEKKETEEETPELVEEPSEQVDTVE